MKWTGDSKSLFYPVIIEHGQERLTDEEINAILGVARTRQAFQQILEDFRQESFRKASSFADDNNPYAMARELGDAEMCTALLLEIENRLVEKKA